MDAWDIQTPTHGRVILDASADSDILLAGFHGYGQTADIMMTYMLGIELPLKRLSIQALHRFYNKHRDIGASWMVSEDRERLTQDNLAYIQGALDACKEKTSWKALIFCGFSQGAAMACRAAALLPCDGLIAVGGDIPPEIKEAGCNFPPTFLARGSDDTFYPAKTFEADIAYLKEHAASYNGCPFTGGHEWSDTVNKKAAQFLSAFDSSS